MSKSIIKPITGYKIALLVFALAFSYNLLLIDFSYELMFFYGVSVTSFLALVYFNYKLHKQHGVNFAQDFIKFPIELLASTFIFFGIAKIGYDTMLVTERQNKEIASKLSLYTEKVVVDTWEQNAMKFPSVRQSYREIFSQPGSDTGDFLTKEAWDKLNIPAPYVPYEGNEEAWHFSAQFVQEMVNIVRMFGLEKKFKINSEADLKKSQGNMYAGWITCFRMYLKSPIVRNVWEQYKYRHVNPYFSAWVKYFVTDPIDNDPDFFLKHREKWNEAMLDAFNTSEKS